MPKLIAFKSCGIEITKRRKFGTMAVWKSCTLINTRVVLFIPKKGSDCGYQKPWTIRGASNRMWSKNTAELGDVSD